MRGKASLRDGLVLALVSIVVVLYISLFTLGKGNQGRVEARLPAILEQADSAGVPVPVLMAVCVAESHRGSVRSDVVLASWLAESLRAERGDVPAALARLYTDRVEQKFVQDLYEMNLDRWSRLAARARES